MNCKFSPIVLSAILISLGIEIKNPQKAFAGGEIFGIRVNKRLPIDYQKYTSIRNKEKPKLTTPTPQIRLDSLPSESVDFKHNLPTNFSLPDSQPSQNNLFEYDRKSRGSSSRLEQTIDDIEKISPQLPQVDYSQQMRNFEPSIPQYDVPKVNIPTPPSYGTEKPKIPNFYFKK